jgi:hypothetical protein
MKLIPVIVFAAVVVAVVVEELAPLLLEVEAVPAEVEEGGERSLVLKHDLRGQEVADADASLLKTKSSSQMYPY